MVNIENDFLDRKCGVTNLCLWVGVLEISQPNSECDVITSGLVNGVDIINIFQTVSKRSFGGSIEHEG